MKKEGLMFGVLGLVVGLVIGFVGANSLNRSAAVKPVASTTAPPISGDTQNLPADHPPIGSTSGDKPVAGPQPQVTAAIEKAKQQPQNYEAQMTVGDLYYQIQSFDDAVKFYEAANKLKPAEKEPMVKAGNAFFDKAETAYEKDDLQGATPDFVQAEKWYTKALAIDSKDLSVRTDLGLTFFQRTPRDIDRAIKEYKTSLEIDPNHEITLQNLALAYTEKGDKEALVKTMERLKKVNPNNRLVKKAEAN